MHVFLHEMPTMLAAKVCAGICSVEMAMTDGTVRAAAWKVLPYDTARQQFAANAELAALRDAEGCCYLGQCLAVFKHASVGGNGQSLSILLE